MQAEPSMESLFRRVAEAAVAEIGAAEFAGISEVEGRCVRTRAATDRLVSEIDDLQYRAGDGPCLTSLREHVTVRSNDLGAENRWPRFAQSAATRGVRSMLAVQLFVARDNLGALNLYATEPDAFDDDHESTAIMLASHAAVAISDSRLATNLWNAVRTRDVIGQAKGILMERYKITTTQAFDLLIGASQHTHRKVHEIAAHLSNTGELPMQ